MKKLKLLLSVFAAVGLLAACDMELNSTLGDEVVSYSEQRLDAGSLKISDSVSVTGTVQTGVIEDGSTFYCMGFSADEGIAVSFNMLNTYTNDWDNVLTTNQATIQLATMGYWPNGTWASNVWESVAASSNGGSYTSYYNSACFVTVSFNADGSICFYKDGLLLLTYAADSGMSDDSSYKIEELCSAFISDITSGENLAVNITTKNLYITEALDDTNAALLYSYDAAQD